MVKLVLYLTFKIHPISYASLSARVSTTILNKSCRQLAS